MRGSQLQGQSPKSLAVEWRDRAIHLILPESTQLAKDHSRELESSVCVIFLKWHCIKTQPYCIILRKGLCNFSATSLHGYSHIKKGGR